MPSVAVLPPAERRLYIRKADVEKYGATEGLSGMHVRTVGPANSIASH